MCQSRPTIGYRQLNMTTNVYMVTFAKHTHFEILFVLTNKCIHYSFNQSSLLYGECIL